MPSHHRAVALPGPQNCCEAATRRSACLTALATASAGQSVTKPNQGLRCEQWATGSWHEPAEPTGWRKPARASCSARPVRAELLRRAVPQCSAARPLPDAPPPTSRALAIQQWSRMALVTDALCRGSAETPKHSPLSAHASVASVPTAASTMVLHGHAKVTRSHRCTRRSLAFDDPTGPCTVPLRRGLCG